MPELTEYQKKSLERFLALYNPRGKNILEIGSDENADVLGELSSKGCNILIGINLSMIKFRSSQNNTWTFINADAMNLPIKSETIDAIISIATFEHISDLGIAFSEMYRILKPRGLVYSNFGPIWSSPHGHHVYAEVEGEEAHFWEPEKNPVPDFAHLLMSPEELESFLLKKINNKLARACIQWIYHEQHLNRYFYKDYIRVFNNSRFKIKLLVKTIRANIDSRIKKYLLVTYGKENDYSCLGFEIVLEKIS
jgi:ubiquinone/menaquinone biosynthesis C-methylase UbiE